jgi:hypothetical protein
MGCHPVPDLWFASSWLFHLSWRNRTVPIGLYLFPFFWMESRTYFFEPGIHVGSSCRLQLNRSFTWINQVCESLDNQSAFSDTLKAFICYCYFHHVKFKYIHLLKKLKLSSYDLLQIVIKMEDGECPSPKAMAMQVLFYLEKNGYLQA